MSKLHVAVLRGGPSSEYDVSLATGATVLEHLPSERYQLIDILIDRAGVWHKNGVPVDPARILSRTDAVWNALHGEWGEDGGVQHLLDSFRVPYNGARTFASAVAMNKDLTKKFLKSSGIKTPYYKVLRRGEQNQQSLQEIWRAIPQPSVVKPLAAGSSVGVSIVRNFDELPEALTRAFRYGDRVLIEEYISGREATCGVVEGWRGEEVYALFPIEIVPSGEAGFFDYQAKYLDDTNCICPGRFSEEEKKEIQAAARLAHTTLNLRHYSRSDFIVSPTRGIYFLEVNTLPGLTSHSLVPKSLAAAGSTISEFLEHVLTLALKER